MISAREALIEDNYYKADEGERRLVPQQVEGDLPRDWRARGYRPGR